jgi:hypothetical protein
MEEKMIITNQKIIDIIEGAEEVVEKNNLQAEEVSEIEQLALASINHAYPYSIELRNFIGAAWGYFLACMTSGRGNEVRTAAVLMTLTAAKIVAESEENNEDTDTPA